LASAPDSPMYLSSWRLPPHPCPEGVSCAVSAVCSWSLCSPCSPPPAATAMA
jgi:hypothetical protein